MSLPKTWRWTKARLKYVGEAVTVLLALIISATSAPAAALTRTNQPALVVTTNGIVEYFQPLKPAALARLNQLVNFDEALLTRVLASATVRFFDWSSLRLADQTRLEIVRDPADTNSPAIRLLEGQFYFSSRGGPIKIPVQTPHSRGLTKGTEFLVRIDPQAARTEFTMFDGEVEVSNDVDKRTIRAGQQGIAMPGQPIEVRPVIEARNLVQWWIYYPAILDPDELGLTLAEQTQLAASLAAYRSGDLQAALKKYPGYPTPAEPDSDAKRIYYAGLLLSVGAVDRAEAHLSLVKFNAPLARALRTMAAAVSQFPIADSQFSILDPATASELLALSYAHQATNNLKDALIAARQAATMKQWSVSPPPLLNPDSSQLSSSNGFAWARVAELEFSFGRTRAAREAVRKAIEFTPQNAQAHALNGFLLAAENKLHHALAAFDRAIEIDPALGNAWLGRGLCKRRMSYRLFRTDDSTEWLNDLQTAAALEPSRSLTRSYLGKAFADAGLSEQALKELAVAKHFDTNDPTPWLYSALLKRGENRINESVRDLESSIEMNDHRAVYRSQLMLDQDRAVRGANLASIYRDAGMMDLGAREAARAVNVDYANFSSHLFLANSYSDLLNYSPQVNLRYETARVSEHLIATLLAPVGAGVLSPNVSQQEYSRLFERDHFGFTSTIEYLSRGAWAEAAAQYGAFGNFGYSLDVYHQVDPGQRANNDLRLTAVSLRLKEQITPSDCVFFQLIFSDARFGDLAQYYDPFNSTNGANPLVQSKETQQPILLAGYHHEWSPHSHTLFLSGRLEGTLDVENPIQTTLVLDQSSNNAPIIRAYPYTTSQEYRSHLEIYTTEVQHLLEYERGVFIFGGRYQAGHFDTKNTNTIRAYLNAANRVLVPAAFANPRQESRSDFERVNGYVYGHWQVWDALRLIGGISYDRLTYPINFRFAPISGEQDTEDQLSPKGGLIVTPWKDTVLRAAYSRSLGGASIDQSFRLEPSQVAGFNQAWRSILPESVAGANVAEHFESRGASIEHKFPTRTYAAVSAEWLKSDVDRLVGAYQINPPDVGVFPTPPYIFQSDTREQLDFEERTLAVTLNQLASEQWAFGARYRLSKAQLDDHFPDLPASVATYGGLRRQQHLEATLHQVNLLIAFNHPSGFFGYVDSIWSAQSNRGYAADIPGDYFWQFNVYAGYRFPRRQAEVRLGLLNLTDQNYRLNPLNLTSELPRERTLAASLRFSF